MQVSGSRLSECSNCPCRKRFGGGGGVRAADPGGPPNTAIITASSSEPHDPEGPQTVLDNKTSIGLAEAMVGIFDMDVF